MAGWGRSLLDRGDRFLEQIGKVVAPIASNRQELEIAIKKRDWSRTLELLAQDDVDMFGTSSDGPTPLHLAASSDFMQCVDYLLEAGVDADLVDKRAETPLHHAARNGHLAVCRRLVEKGASPAKRNDRGQTPYDVATQLMLRQWILPLQLQAEDDVDAPNDRLGPPPVAPPVREAMSSPVQEAPPFSPYPPPRSQPPTFAPPVVADGPPPSAYCRPDDVPPGPASYSMSSTRKDALGRYADGFHSSSSDPVLAAKYGHGSTHAYGHLPPPPTALPPPPTQLPPAHPVHQAPAYRRYPTPAYAIQPVTTTQQPPLPPPPPPTGVFQPAPSV